MAYPAGAVRLTAANDTWTPAFLHKDHLGSVRAISGPDGTTEERTLYRPYGAQSEVVTATLNDDKSWLGERYDAGAGLQYLNARYYDPELAMFLQPDWFEVMQPGVGTNRYSYSFGDPVNLSDPGGNAVPAIIGVCAASPPCAGAAAGAGLALGYALVGTYNMMTGNAGPGIGHNGGPPMNETGGPEGGGSGPAAAAAVVVIAEAATHGASVQGNPQETRGANGASHAAASVGLAAAIVAAVGAENVATISFNQRISTAVPGASSASRPDVTIVTKDGRVITGEVTSPSQTAGQMTDKAQQTTRQIANETGQSTGYVVSTDGQITTGGAARGLNIGSGGSSSSSDRDSGGSPVPGTGASTGGGSSGGGSSGDPVRRPPLHGGR